MGGPIESQMAGLRVVYGGCIALIQILLIGTILVVYSSFFVYEGATILQKPLSTILRDVLEWNKEHLLGLLDQFADFFLNSPMHISKNHVSYVVFLFSCFISMASAFRWIIRASLVRFLKVHPGRIDGKVIENSISCTAADGFLETIDDQIKSVADVRKQMMLFENSMVYTDWKDFHFSSMLPTVDRIASVFEKYCTTDAPIALYGDVSNIKLLGMIGVWSRGRPVVFIDSKTSSAQIAHQLNSLHCEVIFIRHDHLHELENVCQSGYCPSLHTVIYTDTDFTEDSDSSGACFFSEESLNIDFSLEVVSLFHELTYFDEENEDSSRITREFLESSESLSECTVVTMFTSENEVIEIKHRHLIAAASALIDEYHLNSSDIIVIEPTSLTSTLSLVFAALISGASFVLTSNPLAACAMRNPTIVSASTSTYYSIFEMLHRDGHHSFFTRLLLRSARIFFKRTRFFRMVRKKRVSQYFGDHLRLLLNFYSNCPMSQLNYRILMREIGVPCSIVYGTAETCGVCLHSLESLTHTRTISLHGFKAIPFKCNICCRIKDGSLLVTGSNVVDDSPCHQMMDGIRWFNTGVTVPDTFPLFVDMYMPIYVSHCRKNGVSHLPSSDQGENVDREEAF